MTKGQVIAGDFSKVIVRVKSSENIELGEMLVIEQNGQKILLQVFDLLYGSQISQQNLELVSGMNLEENSDFSIMDANLRNYQLAYCKPILTVTTQSKTCKQLTGLIK